MDLVYLYPSNEDAPATVAKSILRGLIFYQKKLPFGNIKLYGKSRYIDDKNDLFNELDSITLSEIRQNPTNYVVHIPISPNIFPNKKLLLNLLCLLKGIPLIIHYHGDVRKHFWMKLLYDHHIDFVQIPSFIFLPFILRKSSILITHSYTIGKLVEDNYDVGANRVIPNGLDDFWYKPLNKNKSLKLYKTINTNKFNVFYHGRLSPEKGVDMLIEAIGNYAKKDPNIMLYVAGEGTYKKSLLKLCSRHNLHENIEFLGNINKEAIKYYLQNVDIAIYPSRFDAFCLAALEALACANCPVFLSKKMGLYDFNLHDNYELNGFEPIESNIEDILCDQNRIHDKEIVNLQHDFSKKFVWDQVVKNYIELYWEIVSREKGFIR